MGTESLGELEQVVLLAVARLGERAYGVAVHRELSDVAGRDLTVPAIYITLGRLEQKGLVASRSGDPTAQRGGRAKKYFFLTREGARALHASRAALDRLWSGVDLTPLLGRRP